MKTEKKPRKDSQGRYRFSEALRFLEVKYGFNANDFNKNSINHFPNWAAARGMSLEPLDSAGRMAVYEQYVKAADGACIRPVMESFSGWMQDLVSPVAQPRKYPAMFRLNVPQILATFDADIAPKIEVQWAAFIEQVCKSQELPERARTAIQRLYEPSSKKLKPFVRTVLGYFEAEFGPSLKFDMRPH